jgi:hypothetical protein
MDEGQFEFKETSSFGHFFKTENTSSGLEAIPVADLEGGPGGPFSP